MKPRIAGVLTALVAGLALTLGTAATAAAQQHDPPFDNICHGHSSTEGGGSVEICHL